MKHAFRQRTVLVASTAVLVLIASGCRGRSELADAYGNFESDEILISSEATGVLNRFDVSEGDQLFAGQLVGHVDTVQLSLQRDQLEAQRRAVRSRTPSILAQIEVIEEQRRVATKDRERIENLLSQGASTPKQLDDVNGQINVLDRQMASIRTQNAPLVAELDVIGAQQALLEYRITRSRIVNPVAGTVLLTYAEAHELTAPGRPLYKIAKLDTMDLRAYVSGAQLSHVRIGQTVSVEIDSDSDENVRLPGTVTWISPQAEFTPKLIQTKEERVNLVYAMKVRVANTNGLVKLGMPGEVWFDGANKTSE
jgi:HlyD family secretion protein